MTILNSERRSHLEMIASILNACRYWTKKTRVMSQCNMTSKQFTRYLDMLLAANLLLVENDRWNLLFGVSEKGKDFLKAYYSIAIMLE